MKSLIGGLDFGILLGIIPLAKSGQGVKDFLTLNLQQLAGNMSIITIESSGSTELVWGVDWVEDH